MPWSPSHGCNITCLPAQPTKPSLTPSGEQVCLCLTGCEANHTAWRGRTAGGRPEVITAGCPAGTATLCEDCFFHLLLPTRGMLSEVLCSEPPPSLHGASARLQAGLLKALRDFLSDLLPTPRPAHGGLCRSLSLNLLLSCADLSEFSSAGLSVCPICLCLVFSFSHCLYFSLFLLSASAQPSARGWPPSLLIFVSSLCLRPSILPFWTLSGCISLYLLCLYAALCFCFSLLCSSLSSANSERLKQGSVKGCSRTLCLIREVRLDSLPPAE